MTNLYAWKSAEDGNIIVYTTKQTPVVGDYLYDADGYKITNKVIDGYTVANLSPLVSGDTLGSDQVIAKSRTVTPVTE